MPFDIGGLNVTGPQLTLATVWQIKRKDGRIFAFTDHDLDLTRDLGNGNGSQTHKAASGYARSALAADAGLGVPNMETAGILDYDGITDADLRAGLFKGAEVWIGEIDWTGIAGLKRMVRGFIGDASVTDYGYQVELKDLKAKLAETEAVQHYTNECNHTFRDSACQYTGPGLTCDKQFETCEAYQNVINFGGFMVLAPGTDVLVRYPLKPAGGTL